MGLCKERNVLTRQSLYFCAFCRTVCQDNGEVQSKFLYFLSPEKELGCFMILSMRLAHYSHHFKGVIMAKKVIEIVSKIRCRNPTVSLLSE